MANLSISTDGKTDARINALQVLNAETVAFDASAASAAFATPFIRIIVTQPAWITFSAAPTAVAQAANNVFLYSNIEYVFRVKPGEKVAVIKDGDSGGNASIAQMN